MDLTRDSGASDGARTDAGATSGDSRADARDAGGTVLDAGAADTPDGGGDASAVPSCPEGDYQCRQDDLWRCVGGVWNDTGACPYGCADNACAPSCLTQTVYRCDGDQQLACSPADGRYHPAMLCEHGCSSGTCLCRPGDTYCTRDEDPGALICNAQGFYDLTPLATCFLCKANMCSGECRPGTGRCTGQVGQTCTADGAWTAPQTCTQFCNDGVCGACPKGAHRCNQGLRDVCTTGAAWEADGPCVTQVGGTTDITCAVKSDGSFSFWGDTNSMDPHLAFKISKVRLLAAGNLHECGVTPDNQVVCDAYNIYGQADVPVGLDGAQIQALVAGSQHTCALMMDGSLVCWGNNSNGRASLPPPPAGVRYTSVATSYDDTCAVRSDGTIICQGTEDNMMYTIPPLPNGVGYVEAAPGFLHSCALRTDGAIICWGDNSTHALDVPTLPLGVAFQHVCAGDYYGCAFRSDGNISCWGSVTKAPPLPAGAKYLSLFCNVAAPCAVVSDGTALCFDDNTTYSPAGW